MQRMRKFLIKVFLVLAIVSFTAAIGLWRFLPKEHIRDILTRELSRRLNQNITLGDFSIGFYPDIEFVAHNIWLVASSTTHEMLSAQAVRFDLNVRELFNRKCVIENITAHSPTLNLIRDTNGAWNVEELIRRVRLKEKKDDTTQPVNWLEFNRIRINNGSISSHDTLSDLQLRIQKIAATIYIKENKIDIDSASILLSPAVEVELSGTVSHFTTRNPALDLKAKVHIKKEGPLADSEPIALPIGARIAEVSLNASGFLATLTIKGTFSTYPLTTAGLPAQGTITGTLKREEGLFEVDRFNISIGKNTLSLSGTCINIWHKGRTAQLQGTAVIALKEAATLIGKDLMAELELEGVANATMALNVSSAKVGLNANIDLLPAGFTIPGVMCKQEGTPSTLAVDAHYSFPDELVIDNVELMVDDAMLGGRVQVKPGSEPWLGISFDTRAFPLQRLNRLPAMRFEDGTITLAAEVWQSSPTQGDIHYRADATIEHATLLAQPFEKPVGELSAAIEVVNQKATIHSASFLFGESRYHAQGEVTNFSTPHVVCSLTTEALDIDAIVDAFAASTPRAEPSDVPDTTTHPGFSVEALIEAESMCIGKARTGAVSTVWYGSDTMHTFDHLQINAFGGELKGTFNLAILEGDITWTADFSEQNMALEVLCDQLLEGKIKGKAKGLMNGEGTLSGVASSRSEDVWKSLGGELTFQVAQGEIKQSPILNTILLVMEVPVAYLALPGLRELTLTSKVIDSVKKRGRNLNVTRMAFKEIGSTFRLAGGVAHTEDLYLKGETVDLLCEGVIDLAREQMDMKIGAAPIGSIDRLLGKVPLVGKKINAVKKSIISLDFAARGPVSEPEVKLLLKDKLTPKRKKE